MLELSRQLKDLKCFLHISTAYAHTNLFATRRSVHITTSRDCSEYIEERSYEPALAPSKLIDLTELAKMIHDIFSLTCFIQSLWR